MRLFMRALLWIALPAYVVATLPACWTGVAAIPWKAWFLDTSEPQQVVEPHILVATPSLRYVRIPPVSDDDFYRADALRQQEAVATMFQVSMRDFQSPMYRVVYSPRKPEQVTIVVTEIDGSGNPIVIELVNVFPALEQESQATQIAMR